LDIFKSDGGLKDEEKESTKKSVKLPCYLNLAACFLKQKNYKSTIENATKALEIDPLNIKALWRRGVALTDNSDWYEAEADFTKALEIDQDNKTVQSAFNRLKKIISKQNNKDRKKFQNMFQRMAELEKEDAVQAEKEKEEVEKVQKVEKEKAEKADKEKAEKVEKEKTAESAGDTAND